MISGVDMLERITEASSLSSEGIVVAVDERVYDVEMFKNGSLCRYGTTATKGTLMNAWNLDPCESGPHVINTYKTASGV